MGATSSENLHLLKLKLPLQNDQRWFHILSWFSKFYGGRPPQTNVTVIYFFQSNTAQHKPSKIQLRVVKHQCFSTDL